MKKIVILFTILLFTLSLLFTVSAEDVFIEHPSSSIESFYISSTSTDLSICSCSTDTDTVQVVNDGSVPVKVNLTSNLDYVSFSENAVNLIPGQIQKVYMYVHAPCNKLSDDLEIIGTSIYGDSQILERKLSFNSCDNLVVIPGDDKQTSVCTPFKDNFTILNTGSFAEDYQVDIKNFNNYSSVAKKTITVPAQTKFDYFVFYNIPCDISGEQTLDYKVTALKNNRVIDFSKNLNITPDYNFDVAGPAKMVVCDSSEESYNITIKNQNHFEDEFLVKLQAPSFVDLKLPDTAIGLESNTLILNASTFTDIPLVVSPKGEKHDGEYNITIEVTSLTGGVVEELVVPLSINHCYDFSNLLNVPVNDVNVCAGETKNVDLVLEHKGVSPAVVELNVTGPDYVSLLSDFVIFDGKEGKTDTLVIKDAPDISQKTSVTIDAYFEGNLVDSASFDLVLSNKTACYNIVVPKSDLEVRSDATELYVAVKNVGSRDGFYSYDAFGLPSYLKINSGAQTINASEMSYLEFDVNRTALIDAANVFNNGSIVGLETFFILSLNNSNGESFNSQVHITFVDKPWYERAVINVASWWNSMNLCLQIFIVLSSLAAVFFLILMIKILLGRHFFSAKTLGLVLLILVVIATITVFVWKGVPTKSMFYTSYDLNTNSTIYLKLQEDSSRSFDLNDFFFDPDNNIVNYTVSLDNASLLSSKIKGTTLKLKPSKDWNGLTFLQLTATDAFGESASSGDIFVDVLPVEDYSCSGLFSLACSYFNLVIFVIMALLFYLLVSFRRGIREVRDEKQLTLMETVVVKKARSPKQDVILAVNKPKKNKTTSKRGTSTKRSKKTAKKSSKKSSKKAVKKAATKKSSGTVKSKVEVSNFKVDNI